MDNQKELVFDPNLIRKFDVNGPRYTSYPTADRFVEAFNADALTDWLGQRAGGGLSRPLSLYFHIPFCNTICYYCACNKIITKDHSRSAKYLKYLAKEVAMQAAALNGSREVIQLHLGGGTPTFLSHDEMRELMTIVRQHFTLLPDGEYSIEVDPRKVDYATVAMLAEAGFNRMYEFFTRYVRRIRPDTHWKRTMKSNVNKVFFQLVTPSDIAFVISLLKNGMPVWDRKKVLFESEELRKTKVNF